MAGLCYRHPLVATVQAPPSYAQDGGVFIKDILASFLDSGVKQGCVVHLYMQCTDVNLGLDN